MPTPLMAARVAVDSLRPAGRAVNPAVDAGRGGWRARAGTARWLLLGAVLIGLFGMHVLTVEDSAGGHGMPPPAVTGHHGHDATTGDQRLAADRSDATGSTGVTGLVRYEVADPVSSGSGPGAVGHDGLASCVLFLVLGGAALLLALLAAYRRRDARLGASGAGAAVAVWLRRRGPPRQWPRVALCVIRT